MKQVCMVALSLVLLPMAAAAGDDPLDGTSEAWIQAFNQGDAAAIAAMYTADAMVLPPNSESIEGREAIEGFWAAALASGLTGSLEAAESGVDGDLGYKVGTYELHSAEGELVDRGKFVEVWTRADGEWLIHRDIYNSSLPAAEDSEQSTE